MSHIIFLNGATSSGKTSLAKQMQINSNEIYVYVSSDQFIGGMPESIKEVHSDQAKLVSIIEGIRDSMYQYIITLCSKGINVIVDSVVLDTDLVHTARMLLSNRIYLIKVTCKTEVLKDREKNRGDRRIGMAEYQVQLIQNPIFDFMIETTDKSPNICAIELQKYMDTNNLPTAFERILIHNN
jgi:chloramphenicol 3-O phosphotransferase